MDRRGGVSSTSEDGAAAVEFAIVSALLFMLVFAIIQFGIIFAQELAISNGARQGARAAAVVSNTCADIATEVRQGAQTIGLASVANPGLVTVQAERVRVDGTRTTMCDVAARSPACRGAQAGDEVVVTATFVGSLIIPLTGINDNSVTVQSSGTYRCEYTQ